MKSHAGTAQQNIYRGPVLSMSSVFLWNMYYVGKLQALSRLRFLSPPIRYVLTIKWSSSIKPTPKTCIDEYEGHMTSNRKYSFM